MPRRATICFSSWWHTHPSFHLPGDMLDTPAMTSVPTGRHFLTTSSDTIAISKGLQSMELGSSLPNVKDCSLELGDTGSCRRHHWLAANSRALHRTPHVQLFEPRPSDDQTRGMLSKTHRVIAPPHRLLNELRLRKRGTESRLTPQVCDQRRELVTSTKRRSCLGKSTRGRRHRPGQAGRSLASLDAAGALDALLVPMMPSSEVIERQLQVLQWRKELLENMLEESRRLDETNTCAT